MYKRKRRAKNRNLERTLLTKGPEKGVRKIKGCLKFLYKALRGRKHHPPPPKKKGRKTMLVYCRAERDSIICFQEGVFHLEGGDWKWGRLA